MSLLSAWVGFAVASALLVLGCALWRVATVLRGVIQSALVAAESLNGLTRQVDVAQLAKALAEAARSRDETTRPFRGRPYDPHLGGGGKLS